MKKFIINHKKLLYLLTNIIFIINYFSHKLIFSWDSSVYLGMSLIIGTSSFKSRWLSVRGISFPFLLRLFEPLGYQNKYLLLLLTFIFYISLLYTIYLIGKKLNLYNNYKTKTIYIYFVLLFIILNPIIFVYYHIILTEFVAMTLNMVFVYLMYNYIRLDIIKDKKKSIIYAFIISLITVFLYHTKQSFIGMIAIELTIGTILSLIRNHNIKNIIYRISTIGLCLIILISSIKLWNTYTNTKGFDNIGTKAVEGYTSKRLIKGLTQLREIGNSQNIQYINGEFVRTVKIISNEWTSPDNITILNENDKNEIIKVLNKESKYCDFTIYEAKNNSNIQYVLFTKNNYSILEQLPLYFKIFYTKPQIILTSYYDGMYKTIMIQGYWAYENRAFTVRYFHGDYPNIETIAPGYEFAVEDLQENNKTNFIDHMAFGYSEILSYIYKINQMLTPILFIISFITTIYTIIKCQKNKLYNKLRDGFEMSLLLYTMAFGCIISYIMFSGFIDRYLMPSHIPMFIGDIIFIIYLIKLFKLKKTLKNN